MNVAPDVAPVVDAAVLSPAVDVLMSAASFFAPAEWVALAVALAVVAALALVGGVTPAVRRCAPGSGPRRVSRVPDPCGACACPPSSGGRGDHNESAP
jgi:hypothetical protein